MTDRPKQESLLGNFSFELPIFPNLDAVLSPFTSTAFATAHPQEISNRINRTLLHLIEEHPPSFLFRAVVNYISRVRKLHILDNYTFSSFELWLNQLSGLDEEQHREIRAKIVGKYAPREDYQLYFPIGMGKKYFGTHFVTAHTSPDLDTTVASFWGWIDSFAAQVGDGLHIWNVPGGPPESQVEIGFLFNDLFDEELFTIVAKKRLSLSLTSLDLMTQLGVSKKQLGESSLRFEYERQKSAVVLVDSNGYYLGDWRAIDVEGVRQLVMSLNNCLTWLESSCHIQLISCFAKQSLTVDHISSAIQTVLKMPLKTSQPAQELPPKQLRLVHDYLRKVLQVPEGIEATFDQFALAIEKIGVTNFSRIFEWIRSLPQSELFDKSGQLIADSTILFGQLEILVKTLSQAFHHIRTYVDQLEIALKIKTEVFGFQPKSLGYRTDIEEIRETILPYAHLTITDTDCKGNRFPLGVIYASDLKSSILGTVTLRDFCNREEMKIPSYLEIISVIDHHKSSLVTGSPPTTFIADAQAASSLVAKLACDFNDKWSRGGMTEETVHAELKQLGFPKTNKEIRLYQKLLQRKSVFQKTRLYWIDPQREFAEYLHFVYAILDDTDLLTKVSKFDILCIGSLLNRLKSLSLGLEVEIIDFDDILENKEFTKKAAHRLVKNPDFYSLYSKVYKRKERAIDHHLSLCAKGQPSNIFSDAKILNHSSRVSQTKLFSCNYASFSKVSSHLRNAWQQQANHVWENNREILLHMHMISTIAMAEDLFEGRQITYKHKDELWIWIPPSIELAIEKLKLFLSAFKTSPQMSRLSPTVLCLGNQGKELARIFSESFLKVPISIQEEKEDLSIAILEFEAGQLNSRKAMIAPYLPKPIG